MKTSSSRLITERNVLLPPSMNFKFLTLNWKLLVSVMIALLVFETTSYNFYSLIAFVFYSAYILCIDHSRDKVETIFFIVCSF